MIPNQKTGERKGGGRKMKERIDNILSDLFDALMRHELLVKIVSSIFGAALGVWLAFEFVIPLIVQR